MRIITVKDLEGRTHQVDADALDAKQFAKDGETHSFSLMAMDTAGGLFICDADQLKGANTMDDNTTKLTDSDIAYIAMCRDLDWRNRTHLAGDTPTKAYDEARADLEQAWKQGR